jgi:hypothetical protein
VRLAEDQAAAGSLDEAFSILRAATEHRLRFYQDKYHRELLDEESGAAGAADPTGRGRGSRRRRPDRRSASRARELEPALGLEPA